MQTEVQWAEIEGYEGYMVSSDGRIYSRKRKIIMRQVTARNGYKRISLKRGQSVAVHRLVAKAFIPNPNNYPEINHIDENKINNSVDNLEWCTRKYNVNYGSCKRKRVLNTDWEKMASKLRKPVRRISADGKITIFRSMKEAEKETGVKNGNISKCCRGAVRTAGGCRWELVEV